MERTAILTISSTVSIFVTMVGAGFHIIVVVMSISAFTIVMDMCVQIIFYSFTSTECTALPLLSRLSWLILLVDGRWVGVSFSSGRIRMAPLRGLLCQCRIPRLLWLSGGLHRGFCNPLWSSAAVPPPFCRHAENR